MNDEYLLIAPQIDSFLCDLKIRNESVCKIGVRNKKRIFAREAFWSANVLRG